MLLNFGLWLLRRLLCATFLFHLHRPRLQVQIHSHSHSLTFLGSNFLPCNLSSSFNFHPITRRSNCVGFGRVVAQREELLRHDVGLLAAADAIGLTVKKLDGDILGRAENWISDWETLIGSEAHVHVVGSPKVSLYETDFGWRRPKKIEEVSIDRSKAISLTESRDMKGGIEIGLTQPNHIMSAFSALFTQELLRLFSNLLSMLHVTFSLASLGKSKAGHGKRGDSSVPTNAKC